jgi:lipopolysaccharide export LptBFGC system permease protein LptF
MYYNNFFFSNAIECKTKFEDTKEKCNDFNDHEYGRLVLPFCQLTFAIICVCFSVDTVCSFQLCLFFLVLCFVTGYVCFSSLSFLGCAFSFL